MLKKLKAHWKVNSINLVLIITTFALGGSLCGYTGRKLLLLTNLEKGIAWFILYILLVTLLWPLCVILISIPLGQFSFFKRYLFKVWKKLTGNKKKTLIRVAIFASGTGSNAEKIITSSPALLQREKGEVEIEAKSVTTSSPALLQREKGEAENKAKADWEVALIVCNKPGAGVLSIAAKHNTPTLLIEKENFFNGDNYLTELYKHQIDFIVLAGFLWKMPMSLIEAYPKKIINIHPALLPKYGGKGMYGSKVHEAVIAAGEKESGITIHYVDELYDHGEIIFQATCNVANDETPETLAQKIHALEHAHYPAVTASLLQKQNHS